MRFTHTQVFRKYWEAVAEMLNEVQLSEGVNTIVQPAWA